VSGFLDRRKARIHTQKHFLSPDEHWDALEGRPAPREFLHRLVCTGFRTDQPYSDLGANDTCRAILGEAAARYEATVRDGTATPAMVLDVAIANHKAHDEGAYEVRSLCLVSALGIFIAFVDDTVSHLATAYRPLEWIIGRRGPRREDFIQGARRKLGEVRARGSVVTKREPSEGIDNMVGHARTLADALSEALDNLDGSKTALIHVALDWCLLTRALSETAGVDPDIPTLLERARATVRDGDIGDLDLVAEATAAFERLSSWTARSEAERDVLDGQTLLRDLDAVACVSWAMLRAGRMTSAAAAAMSNQLRAGMFSIVDGLSDLAPFALEWTASFGAAADAPNLFAWWDLLTDLAPSQIVTRWAVRQLPSSLRAGIIDDAVSRFARPSVVERLREALGKFEEWVVEATDLFPVPEPARFAAGQGKPTAGKDLFVDDAVAVHAGLGKVLIQVGEGHSIGEATARLDDGLVLETWIDADSCVVVTIPPEVPGHKMRVAVRLDGEVLDLPLIRVDK
jgi:hypothetical protein